MQTKEKPKKKHVATHSIQKSKKKENEEEEVLVVPKKIVGKPIEIEEIEILVETEKAPDEAVLEDGEAEETDEAGLVEEDLDPFGDKWEQ